MYHKNNIFDNITLHLDYYFRRLFKIQLKNVYIIYKFQPVEVISRSDCVLATAEIPLVYVKPWL